MKGSGYDHIYAVVKRIPRGRVATYGQVAKLAGIGGKPRLVGYALSILSEEKRIPWHRVVNAQGEISRRWEMDAVNLQRDLLEEEGIVFHKELRLSLARFRWLFGEKGAAKKINER